MLSALRKWYWPLTAYGWLLTLATLPLAVLTRWPNLSAAPHASTAMLSVMYQLALSVAAPSPSTWVRVPAMEGLLVGSDSAYPPTTAKRLPLAVSVVPVSWAKAAGATARVANMARVK